MCGFCFCQKDIDPKAKSNSKKKQVNKTEVINKNEG